MNFRVLTIDDLPRILEWRSQCPEALRTNKELTIENQEKWYAREIVNRESRSRWWGICIDDPKLAIRKQLLIGYCAIENIQWENRRGEISLLIDPQYHGKGYGTEAVKMLFDKAFNLLNLENIWGECYFCNLAYHFWNKEIDRYKGKTATLIDTKFWNGKYYNSLWFRFNREEVLACLKG